MGNIDEILSPTIKEPSEVNKEVKVQDTGRQLILPLPALFTQVLNIKKGHKFILKASIDGKEYSIKLKQNGKTKKS
jgi:hypothetical protein